MNFLGLAQFTTGLTIASIFRALSFESLCGTFSSIVLSLAFDWADLERISLEGMKLCSVFSCKTMLFLRWISSLSGHVHPLWFKTRATKTPHPIS